MDSTSIKIFIARNGDRSGPFTLEEINHKRATGELRDNDYAWYEGQKNWIPLVQIPGLTPMAVPPPPPATNLPPVPASAAASNATLARWITFFFLGAAGFILLLVVIYAGIMIVCGAVVGAQAAINHHAQGYEAGKIVGAEAGRAFGQKYGVLIFLLSATSAFLISGLLSWRLSFSNLFPWCRKN